MLQTIDETLRAICAERPPDLVLAYCSGMAQFAVQPPLADIPFVLDLVDVDSQKWRELAYARGRADAVGVPARSDGGSARSKHERARRVRRDRRRERTRGRARAAARARQPR